MGEPLLKTKNGKVIGLILFTVIAVGIYMFFMKKADSIVAEQNDEIATTEKLPDNIKQLLSGSTFGDKKMNFEDLVQSQVEPSIKYQFNKYLYFKDGIIGQSQTKLNAIYDKNINDLLGSSEFLNVTELDGIILRKQSEKTIGLYKDEDGQGNLEAKQSFYTLTFVKLPEKIVVCRDTVWGGLPEKKINIRDGKYFGTEPESNELIKVIKSNLRSSK